MDVVDRVKKEVDKITSKNEVILFGSRARGTHREHSDWDFLILIDREELTNREKDDLRDILYDLELELDEIISTIIHTKKEWEALAVTPLYRIVKGGR